MAKFSQINFFYKVTLELAFNVKLLPIMIHARTYSDLKSKPQHLFYPPCKKKNKKTPTPHGKKVTLGKTVS